MKIILLLCALLSLAAGQVPLVGSGGWRALATTGLPTARHESCAVLVAGSVYIIGGRGVKPVDVLNVTSNTWTARAGPGYQIHHMQCVAYQDRYIYLAGAWTGFFPNETALEDTVRYDTLTDTWANEPGLGARSRGGAAAVMHDGKLYLAMGNRGGHGAHATTLGELDVYDPVAKTWAALPSAPDARDHVTGAVVGGKLCVAGGRDGGVAAFWATPVTRINCFDFATGVWEQRANLPHGRAGAAAGATCGGLLMVAGGEGIPFGAPGKAYDRVDLYDVATDSFLAPTFLTRARHGSGLGVADCACGNIYLPAGSGGLGGGPELQTTEVWSPDGAVRSC